MMRIGVYPVLTSCLAILLAASSLRADSTNQPPDFAEVYQLLRTHLAGISEAELDRAAVQGLLSALGPRVSLAGKSNQALSSELLLAKTNLLEGDVALLSIGRVEAGLAEALRGAYDAVKQTNQLIGLVLDLRFADGQDYAAATEAAGLFLKDSHPLLDWGNGLVRSKEQSDALPGPTAILVNRQTAGAAEALAAMLRETGAGLIIGGRTAGLAMISQEFLLKNGQRLRIATTPVQLGDGSALSTEGLEPDIPVDVKPSFERAYYTDPFAVLGRTNLQASHNLSPTNTLASTNRVRRPRPSEAELVRQRRERGSGGETDVEPSREAEPEGPLVRDPVLARALDVLKGLAIVRASHHS